MSEMPRSVRRHRHYVGLLLAVVAVALCWPPTVAAADTPDDTITTTTPIQHLVLMMQDNHSFDNYFGTYPGADGIPEGTCLPVRVERPQAGCVEPFHLGESPLEDLSHGAGIQRRQYNDGQMNGFVSAYRRLGQDGSSVMGYYDDRDIPYYWNVADRNVLFDRFFASSAISSRESYLYWLTGRLPSGRSPLTSSAGYDGLDTIFDRLADRDVPAKFYVEHLDKRATAVNGAARRRPSQDIKVPLLSMRRFLDGGPLAGRIVDLSQYYTDVRTGQLPAVSYIVTSGSSENPPARPQAGQETVRKISSELVKSDAWNSSALLWTYDGWGGWYDHVAPPSIDGRQLGFRVPALLMSPYAPPGMVNHTTMDYTALLDFIVSNWRLAPIAGLTGRAPALAGAFDFTAAPRAAELLPATRPGPQPATTRAFVVIYLLYGLAFAGVAVLLLAVRWSWPLSLGRLTAAVAGRWPWAGLVPDPAGMPRWSRWRSSGRGQAFPGTDQPDQPGRS